MALAWVEDWVEWLSFYVYRIVPLLSLVMYLILAVFSESRRREGKGWKRGLLWLAYQLTDWGPAYVISNLYLETSPREKMIVAFWVPFLLLHHARPDNISAYTIEDSELWLRLIVFVPLQSLGSILIVYRYILTDCTTGLLRQASIIMLFVGLFKYVESAAALWLGDLSRIRRSFRKLQPIARDDCVGDKNLKDGEALEDEVALLVAHSLFDICKGAFADYSENMHHDDVRILFSDQWVSMCKVVEMELSLMYDILYTKAAMVHTWHGYIIRVASPPLTATALLLFGLQCKEGMKTEDEVISYILLVTTFLLDVRWLLRALASAWTHSYVKLMPCSRLKHEILCRRRWHKLRHWVVSLCLFRFSLWLWTCDCAKEPKSYSRWAGTFGQRNLFDQRTAGNKHNLCSRPRLTIVSEGQWRSSCFESEDYSRDLEIPNNVKKLVYENICKILISDPATHPKQSRKDPVDRSIYTLELQEAILIWQIATDVFLLCNPRISGAMPKEFEAIKKMSNYMTFLVAKRPKMIPGLKIRSLYKRTRDKLKEIRDKAATKELAKWMTNNLDDLKDRETSITIWEGTRLARVLLRQVLGGRQDEVSIATLEEVKGTAERLAYWLPDFGHLTIGDTEGMLEFILDSWVRMLMYASIRSDRDSHARQLSCGGELTTLVWIITQHAKVRVIKQHLQPILPRRNSTHASPPETLAPYGCPFNS